MTVPWLQPLFIRCLPRVSANDVVARIPGKGLSWHVWLSIHTGNNLTHPTDVDTVRKNCLRPSPLRCTISTPISQDDKPIVGRRLEFQTERSIWTQAATGGPILEIGGRHFQLFTAWNDVLLIRWPSCEPSLNRAELHTSSYSADRMHSQYLDYGLLPLGQNAAYLSRPYWLRANEYDKDLALGRTRAYPNMPTAVIVLSSEGHKIAVLDPVKQEQEAGDSSDALVSKLLYCHSLRMEPQYVVGLADRGAAVVDLKEPDVLYGHVISSSDVGTRNAHMTAITGVIQHIAWRTGLQAKLVVE
ncbi:hypothetical protein B0T17DRAFT_505848 [Bombardia bombarda]|uniref:Uncharacterized protein n=1 Tax=Bombardia bombarda TaxID=252184 RepID=A0AA39X9K9_9PEZI|nr:hypothetical protein B0T17DRAFT_505848 [Bombardia bombarda]